jgi:hypothetical protein
MIKVIDNLLDQSYVESISQEVLERTSWESNWNDDLTKSPDWNWHQDLENNNQRVLWDAVDRVILDVVGVRHKLDRVYSNAHTYGQDGQIHRDDGNITAIYYPLPWDVRHEGGTSFYDEEITECISYSSYKQNRLVIFDAKIPHRAMPVTRDCYALRSVIVFKTSMDVNDPTYMDWYYGSRS